MFKEKLRNIVSVAAIIFVLILSAVLFLIRSRTGYSYNDEYFSREDIYDNWDESRTHRINLEDYRDSLTLEDGGYYELSGSLEGQVIISGNSQNVYFIRLNGVDITNDSDACILVKKANKVVLDLVEGSKNHIYTGPNGDDDESIDGAIYSKTDLTIRGSGSLDITAEYRHGIVCNDKLVLTGGNIGIKAKEDGIHANDLIAVRNTVIDITAGDDGITVKNDDGTGTFFGESGEILISECYEGVEADEVIIENGKYSLYPYDDGINAITKVDIRGGDIRIENTEGRDCDGIDSNGDILISGGNIYISLPQGAMNMPLDYGEESGGKLEATGGNIEAYVGGEKVDAIERAAQGMGGGFRGGFRDDFRGDFGGDAPPDRPAGPPPGDAGDFKNRPDFTDRPAGPPPGDAGDFKNRPDFTDRPASPPPGEGGDLKNRPDFTERPADPPPGEGGDLNRTDSRNDPRGIIALLGFSAIALALAILIVLIKKSRANIR